MITFCMQRCAFFLENSKEQLVGDKDSDVMHNAEIQIWLKFSAYYLLSS